jgi:hypothetical protein
MDLPFITTFILGLSSNVRKAHIRVVCYWWTKLWVWVWVYITTDGQSASLSWCQAPIWGLRPDIYYYQTVAGLLTSVVLSSGRTGLPFTIAAGSRQRSHSWVQVPRDSWPYFTVSDWRLPKPGALGPRIYISQEQGDPVLHPGTGFPFRRLLWLGILRPTYDPSAGTNRKRSSAIVACVSVAVPTWSLLSQSIGALAAA